MVAAPGLRQQLADTVKSGRAKLVIALSEVPFVDSSGLAALIRARQAAREAPGDSPPGRVRLRLRADGRAVEALFADRGRPFRGDASRDLSDPMALGEGGFGLSLARAAVDELAYNRTPGGVNRWRLVKRAPSG